MNGKKYKRFSNRGFAIFTYATFFLQILADIATTPIDTSDIMTPAVNHVTTDDFDIDALINIPHHGELSIMK